MSVNGVASAPFTHTCTTPGRNPTLPTPQADASIAAARRSSVCKTLAFASTPVGTTTEKDPNEVVSVTVLPLAGGFDKLR